MHAPDLDPYHQLGQMIRGAVVTQLLAAVARLRVADHLADGPLTATELAHRCDAHPDAMHRTMRTMASVGVFSRDGALFHLNDRAAVLRSDAESSLRFTAMAAADPAFWQPYGAAMHTIRTGERAPEYVLGSSVFDYYHDNPDEADTFNKCMVEGNDYRGDSVLDALDLDTTTRVADIGAGEGSLLTAILLQHLDLTATLFDLHHVVETARHTIEVAGVGNRCDIVGGDFFHDRLPDDADLYLLERIIHDWDDIAAHRILCNVGAHMPTGARLVLIEHLLPQDDPAHCLYDITMMIVFGGRERTAQEYETLLNGAGFELHSITTTNSGSSLIEARLEV